MRIDRSIHHCLFAAALLAVPLISSCAARSTFPPNPGALAVEPWAPPVPELMASGLEYARKRHAPTAEPLFNVPAGVPQWVWEDVQKRLEQETGEAWRIYMDGDPGRALTVTQIRTDGGKGEVDVVYPTETDLYQALTVGFRGDPFQAWRPVFEREWRVPTAAPRSNWTLWPVHESNDYANVKP